MPPAVPPWEASSAPPRGTPGWAQPLGRDWEGQEVFSWGGIMSRSIELTNKAAHRRAKVGRLGQIG